MIGSEDVLGVYSSVKDWPLRILIGICVVHGIDRVFC